MANVDRVNGLKPVGHLHGAGFNGTVEMMLIASGDSTDTFVGDAVKSAGSAGSAGTVVNGIDVEGMATVVQAAAGDTLVGVIVGFLPNFSDLSVKYRVGSTNRIALVATSPDVVFEIQEDSDSENLAATAVGGNVDLVVGSGSTTTGLSGMEIDSSSKVGTTAQLRLLGLVPRADNAIGTNAKWLVVINEHERKATAGV